MALLRSAMKLGRTAVRPTTAALLRTAGPAFQTSLAPFASRGLSISAVRKGHNLEDHFDMAEFVTKMHTPAGEYLVWGMMFSMFFITMGPLLHSNYYFTGRFMPKDQGNTQLCDDSW